MKKKIEDFSKTYDIPPEGYLEMEMAGIHKPSDIIRWALETKKGKEYYLKEIKQYHKDVVDAMEKQLFDKPKVWKKYSNKEVAKLERYRRILIRVLNKYWDSGAERKLYKHQEARIWRMINMEFPDIIILDNHYND